MDLRSDLVKRSLLHGLPEVVESFLHRMIQAEKSELDVVKETIAQIQKLLRQNKKFEADNPSLLASVKLLRWLAIQGERYASHAPNVPLLAKSGEIRIGSGEPSFLLPDHLWPLKAKPYAAAFPESRVLHDVYAGTDDDTNRLLGSALVKWNLTHTHSLLWSRQVDIDDKRLRHYAARPDTGPHKLGKVTCTSIPFLNEIIGATSKNRERARLFFQFVANYVAVTDASWRSTISRDCECGNHPQAVVQIVPCEWLAAIRFNRWVASEPDEKGDIEEMQASPEVLKALIANWDEILQTETGEELLGQLGFDRLELKMRSLAGSDETEIQRIKEALVGLLDFAGGVEGVDELMRQAEEKRSQQEKVQRNRDLGLHIQSLISKTIDREGLLVDDVGYYGYDLRVYPKGQPDDVDADIGVVRVGEYFIEVKATTSDRARMTPTQAGYAVTHRDNYVLCVVDLRLLPGNWSELDSNDIEPAVYMVTNIGETLSETHERLQYAQEDTNRVHLENVQQLRYGVHETIWKNGWAIQQWIKSIKPLYKRDG